MLLSAATASDQQDETGKSFLQRYSIELSPSDTSNFAPSRTDLEFGSRVFLTHLENKPLRAQVEAAQKIIEMGYVPVPHLGARNFQTIEQFRSHLADLTAVGVKQALVIGGNPKTSRGPFSEALHILDDAAFRDSGITTVFLGVYPEGHPDIKPESLSVSLAEKVEQCRQLKVEPRFISQFAFDGAKLAPFVREINIKYKDIPFHLGVAGVTSLPKLIKFAVMCGVGPSLSVLRKSGSAGLLNIMELKTPSDLLESFQRSYDARLPAVSLHFFPFGGWAKTVSWMSEVGKDYTAG